MQYSNSTRRSYHFRDRGSSSLDRSALYITEDMSLQFVIFALTLHAESFSRHRDVVLALRGEAVMWQVVVLWEFHQGVICRGQRLEKARSVDKNRLRSRNRDTSVLSGADERCEATLGGKDTSKFSDKQNIMQKKKKKETHTRERGG